MFRRSFIKRITLATAGAGLAAAGTPQAGERKTVTYRVKGFSCVTCAAGLDTMLCRQKGVVRSKSSYPDAITVVEFKPDLVTEKAIYRFISEMGFTAEEVHRH
jgi:Cu+-exporting ATPase